MSRRKSADRLFEKGEIVYWRNDSGKYGNVGALRSVVIVPGWQKSLIAFVFDGSVKSRWVASRKCINVESFTSAKTRLTEEMSR